MYRRAYRTSTPRMRVTEDNRSSDFSSRLLVRRSEIFSLPCATRNVAHGATHTFLDVSASLCRSSVRAWAASVVRYYGRMRTLTTHDLLFNNTHTIGTNCVFVPIRARLGVSSTGSTRPAALLKTHGGKQKRGGGGGGSVAVAAVPLCRSLVRRVATTGARHPLSRERVAERTKLPG